MEILSISKEKNETVVKLNSNELVMLCNTLFQATKDADARAIIYKMYDSLMFARDLCQYGHIDDCCLENIIDCRKKGKEVERNER